MKTIYEIESNKNYLSEVIDTLPSHVLLNKGMVGCGGTTLELTCKRNSIVLVPTINLVNNKATGDILGVTGTVKPEDIKAYIKNNSIPYKKIIATYDSLLKLIEIIGKNIYDYFLLIDEYHYLFTNYKFRNIAIKKILDNYIKFKDWCFMTATPLSEFNILEELKDVDTISYVWKGKAKLDITFSPTEFYLKLLENRIKLCLMNDYNLHIFINSFKTIKHIIKKFDKLKYRVICSPYQKDKSSLNFQHINSNVSKINFYTATAFEGCDIFDEDGRTIVVSDTRLPTTMMDISIHIVQIAGRLRNSKYLNQLEYIYSASSHRYLNKNDVQFQQFTEYNHTDGLLAVSLFNKGNKEERRVAINRFNPDYDFGLYINSDQINLYHDPNLKACDNDNYRIFMNLSNLYTQLPKVEPSNIKFVMPAYKSEIEELAYKFLLKGHEYTKPELEQLFIHHGLIGGVGFGNNFIFNNFDNFKSYRKTIKGSKYTVYNFY